GQRRSAEGPAFSMQRVPGRCVKCGFGTYNFDRRIFCTGSDGITGYQTTATDRNDECVDIVDVLEHFECDRALPCDNTRIVVRVNEHQAALSLNSFAARL